MMKLQLFPITEIFENKKILSKFSDTLATFPKEEFAREINIATELDENSMASLSLSDLEITFFCFLY